jgi:IclR family pca regulon transcriptional regulator
MAKERQRVRERKGPPVASLAKGLRVLEELAAAGTSSRLPDLIRRTEFDRATVHRILRTFMDIGYIERRSRGEYVVSYRAYLMGAHLTSAHNLIQVARPRLYALRETIGETTNLAILDNTEIVYLIRAEVTRTLSLSLDVGTRLPAFCASLGRAILAYLPEDEAIDVVTRSDRRAYTPYTKTTVPDLMDALKIVRARGLAVSNQEFEIGLCSMACPILGPDGMPVAAINIALLAARMSATRMAKRFKEPLQETCNSISRELGWNRTLADMAQLQRPAAAALRG